MELLALPPVTWMTYLGHIPGNLNFLFKVGIIYLIELGKYREYLYLFLYLLSKCYWISLQCAWRLVS